MNFTKKAKYIWLFHGTLSHSLYPLCNSIKDQVIEMWKITKSKYLLGLFVCLISILKNVLSFQNQAVWKVLQIQLAFYRLYVQMRVNHLWFIKLLRSEGTINSMILCALPVRACWVMEKFSNDWLHSHSNILKQKEGLPNTQSSKKMPVCCLQLPW